VAGGRNPAQKALVVGEVATSLVLLVAAALLLTSFWNLVQTPAGFDASNVLTFKTSFTDEQAATSAVFSQYLNDLIARIEAQPGVESAAAALNLPTQIVPDWPFDIIAAGPENKVQVATRNVFRSPQTICCASYSIIAGEVRCAE